MSDAAHLLSDFSGFGISLFAIWMSQRPASGPMSFGYNRAEIIGALCSIVLIWGLTAWLLYEAVLRVITPPIINSKIMVITATIGLGFNLILVTFLHGHSHDHAHTHGHDHDHDHEHAHDDCHDHREEHKHEHHHKKHKKSKKKNKAPLLNIPLKYSKSTSIEQDLSKPFLSDFDKNYIEPSFPIEERINENEEHHVEDKPLDPNVNVRAAMIHVIGDIIQSIGVLIAAIIIFFFPDYTICDPICTFLFSILVMFTTIPIVGDCVNVLMEGSPQNIDTEKVINDINKIEGVEDTHDLHIWSLSLGKPALSVHLKTTQPSNTLKKATKLIKDKYQIFHSTIQVEDEGHKYKCANVLH